MGKKQHYFASGNNHQSMYKHLPNFSVDELGWQLWVCV